MQEMKAIRGQVRLYLSLWLLWNRSVAFHWVIRIRRLYLDELCVCVSACFSAAYSFICATHCLTKQLSFVIVAPISSGTPRISRSNSIGPPSDSACELYGSSPLGSSMSLADRPKSMMRSGSFREPGDDGEPTRSASLQGSRQDGLKWNKAVCSYTQSVEQNVRKAFVFMNKERGEDSLCLHFRL